MIILEDQGQQKKIERKNVKTLYIRVAIENRDIREEVIPIYKIQEKGIEKNLRQFEVRAASCLLNSVYNFNNITIRLFYLSDWFLAAIQNF